MAKLNGDKVSPLNMHQLPFVWLHHTMQPLSPCPFHPLLLYFYDLCCLLGGFYMDEVKSRGECASGVQWAWWLSKQENGWTHHSPHGCHQGLWQALMVLLTAMSYGSVTNELPKWENTTSQPSNLALTKNANNEIHSLCWLQWEVDGWLGMIKSWEWIQQITSCESGQMRAWGISHQKAAWHKVQWHSTHYLISIFEKEEDAITSSNRHTGDQPHQYSYWSARCRCVNEWEATQRKWMHNSPNLLGCHALISTPDDWSTSKEWWPIPDQHKERNQMS